MTASAAPAAPPGPPPRLPGASRLPRRTVRLKLTLLYGVLFLASGAALLGVTYVLVSHDMPMIATAHSQTVGGSQTAGGSSGASAEQYCFVDGSGGSLPASLPSNGCSSLLAQQRNDEMQTLLVDSGIALAIMAAVSIGLGWLVAGRVLSPLRTITTAAQRISASNLHHRLPLHGPDDELRDLGQTFNGLLARLEGAFGAQRQFVANASHELRTPLARQRTLAEVALRDPEPTVAGMRETLHRVLITGEQQERLIEALLTLARSQRGLDRRDQLDLAEVTAEALPASEPEARARGLAVNITLSSAPALGDPRLAERLAANLVSNAVRHNMPGGWVEVVTGTRSGQAVLSVANTGPVIAPEQVDLLFQPFGRLETARLSRDGIGLGLSIVTAIAEAHDADLRARPRPGGGLEVEVRFPEPPPGSELADQHLRDLGGVQGRALAQVVAADEEVDRLGVV
jgi:signal transduction histidine kinase